MRTGAFDGEEALLRAHLARALTGRALLGLGARFRARAAAAFAGDRRIDAQLRVLAVEGFFQRDLEIVAQVGAAVLTARLASAHELAEEIVEHVGERRGEIETEAVGAGASALLEGCMAEAVIGRALVAVLQDLVGLGHFLEFVLAAVVALIAVGVELFGEFSVGAFDLFDRGGLLAAQNFVIAALTHGSWIDTLVAPAPTTHAPKAKP